MSKRVGIFNNNGYILRVFGDDLGMSEAKKEFSKNKKVNWNNLNDGDCFYTDSCYEYTVIWTGTKHITLVGNGYN